MTLLVVCAVALVIVGLLAASWAPDLPFEVVARRWAYPSSRYVSLDGLRVHVRDEGPRDDPVPIVLLHGLASNLRTWDRWVERLRTTRRVIAIDRPGFGLTGPDPVGDYGNARGVDVVSRLLTALDVERCVLVGHSAGGRIAWHVALLAPARVQRLVLIGAGGYPRAIQLPLGLRVARTRIGTAVLSRFLPRWAVVDSLRGVYGDPSRVTAETVEWNRALMRRAGNRAVLGEAIRRAFVFDDAERIRDVRVPTLLLWGGRDRVVPLEDGRRFHDDIRGSELVVVESAGHQPHEEAPERTVTALLDFLHRTDATG